MVQKMVHECLSLVMASSGTKLLWSRSEVAACLAEDSSDFSPDFAAGLLLAAAVHGLQPSAQKLQQLWPIASQALASDSFPPARVVTLMWAMHKLQTVR